MSPLVIVAIGLCLGWVVFWVLLERQARRQSELEKKIEELESTDCTEAGPGEA